MSTLSVQRWVSIDRSQLLSTSPTIEARQRARQLEQRRLVIASHNAGKVAEVAELLRPWRIKCVSAKELTLSEPEETGETFVDNAILKARAATTASHLPALADDSGLAVSALGDAPGIHSARWAGPERDFSAAMGRVERALKDHRDRTARFVCALALAWPDGGLDVFEGEVAGTLVWPPRGDSGFGYDPMFVADGMRQTFGEIDPKIKHANSHRAHAFAKLAASCLPSRIGKKAAPA